MSSSIRDQRAGFSSTTREDEASKLKLEDKPGADGQSDGNGEAEMMVKFEAAAKLEAGTKSREVSRGQVKSKYGRDIPDVKPQQVPARVPSHYVTAAGKMTPTARTPGRRVASETPQQEVVEKKGPTQWVTNLLKIFGVDPAGLLWTQLKGLMGSDVAEEEMKPVVVQGVHVPEDTDYRQESHSLLHSEGPAIDAETLRMYYAERRMPAVGVLPEADEMQMDEVTDEVLAELRLVIEAALRHVKARGAFKADVRFGAKGQYQSERMVTEVMLNLLQMKLADKTQALLALDSGDRQLITVVSEIASHHMLQGLSEHGIWSVQAGQLRALWETSDNKSSGGIKCSGGQYAAIADEADFNLKDLDSSESESEDEIQVEVAEPASVFFFFCANHFY